MTETERTLSKNEAKVVLDLEWRGQKAVTAAEDCARCWAAPTAMLASSRTAWSRSAGSNGPAGPLPAHPCGPRSRGHRRHEPAFAGALLADRRTSTRSPRPAPIRVHRAGLCRGLPRCEATTTARYDSGHPVRLHARSPAPLLWVRGHDVLGAHVQMATPERALLDALDRPRSRAASGRSRAWSKTPRIVSPGRRFSTFGRWDESAIVQRLGYFLDLHRRRATAACRRGAARSRLADKQGPPGPPRRTGARPATSMRPGASSRTSRRSADRAPERRSQPFPKRPR